MYLVSTSPLAPSVGRGGENFSGKRVRRQENIFSAHPLMTDDLPFGGVGSPGDDR